jgi:hypothetical protein
MASVGYCYTDNCQSSSGAGEVRHVGAIGLARSSRPLHTCTFKSVGYTPQHSPGRIPTLLFSNTSLRVGDHIGADRRMGSHEPNGLTNISSVSDQFIHATRE